MSVDASMINTNNDYATISSFFFLVRATPANSFCGRSTREAWKNRANNTFAQDIIPRYYLEVGIVQRRRSTRYFYDCEFASDIRPRKKNDLVRRVPRCPLPVKTPTVIGRSKHTARIPVQIFHHVTNVPSKVYPPSPIAYPMGIWTWTLSHLTLTRALETPKFFCAPLYSCVYRSYLYSQQVSCTRQISLQKNTDTYHLWVRNTNTS